MRSSIVRCCCWRRWGSWGWRVMALLDHAQNGFYLWVEWAPIIMGVFSGVVYLIGFWYPRPDEGVRRLLLAVAWAVLLVGLVGTFFHVVGFIESSCAHQRAIRVAGTSIRPAAVLRWSGICAAGGLVVCPKITVNSN